MSGGPTDTSSCLRTGSVLLDAVRFAFGTGSTTLKDLKKEIGLGLLSSMCRDLGIRRTDL
jgi:hypothetical protein